MVCAGPVDPPPRDAQPHRDLHASAPADPPAPQDAPPDGPLLPEALPPRAVVCDVHEPPGVARALAARGVPIEVRRLQPADYVVGPIAVERKTVGDFASSLFNKRLFDQVDRLRTTYDQAVLVVEGDLAELEEFRNPAAFYGAMCHIGLDRGVPVLPTPDVEGTALLLATMHKRLEKDPSRPGLRHKPPALNPRQEQLFLLQGLPGVGAAVSENLLDHFGTVRRVLRAQERELRRIPLVGGEKARRITDVLDRPWVGRQHRLQEEER
jgi:DNA excision repair protein ERCC-4